jgi:hypothetical protein
MPMPAGESIRLAVRVLFLHQTGRNNPRGVSRHFDKVRFHPYFSTKDLFGISRPDAVVTAPGEGIAPVPSSTGRDYPHHGDYASDTASFQFFLAKNPPRQRASSVTGCYQEKKEPSIKK